MLFIAEGRALEQDVLEELGGILLRIERVLEFLSCAALIVTKTNDLPSFPSSNAC